MKKLLISALSLSLLLAGCGEVEKDESKKVEEKIVKKENVDAKKIKKDELVLSKENFYNESIKLIKESDDYWDDNWFKNFNPIRKGDSDGKSELNEITAIKEKMKDYKDAVYSMKTPKDFNADQIILFDDFKKNFNFSLDKKMVAATQLEHEIKNNEMNEDRAVYITKQASESNKYYSDALISLGKLKEISK